MDVSDFTLVLLLAKDELERLATNIPEMAEVIVHILNNKCHEINRNYPYTMPDWLKIMLTVTSTILAIILVVVVIYAKKSGNCLCGKHRTTERTRIPI